jgi:peroxiredoxin
MSLSVGQAAPNFTLVDSDKNQVTLSELKGKNVLLLFFPLAFTGVCTAELCNVRDNIGLYQNVNATVLGISVDAPPALAVFREQQNFNFPLLSDFNKEASTAYGSIYEKFAWGLQGVSKRSAFVVDKEGNIAYAEVLEDAGKVPDFAAINAVLASLG